MEPGDIDQLRSALKIPESAVVETHISWVLLTDQYVYKIKKPVSFSFLDFSTLEKRHNLCLREVELNRRLTDDMYLGVVPVRKASTRLSIDSEEGEVIDYAVKMRRLPGDRQMDVMLRNGTVTHRHIEQLAQLLATFHRNATIPDERPDPEVMLADFADLRESAERIRTLLGTDAWDVVLRAIEWVDRFLHSHADRIAERYNRGFVVDGHGDLHSRNIFLLDIPVIFDCIEFNDHFRYVDVLDELAFFCLDLELCGEDRLARHFLNSYMELYPCMPKSEDKGLFHYFQLYRSGVKLKINLLKISEQSQDRQDQIIGYFRMFQRYLSVLEADQIDS